MTWLLAVVLLANPAAAAAPVASQAAEDLPQAETGTLIFSRGDCLAVRVFSASRFTHVGVVVVRDGMPMVYDSMNGTGVRSQTLADYLESQRPCRLDLLQPAKEFTAAETQRMTDYLDSEVGRPYGVRHHLTGSTASGIHCAEYVTQGLIACSRVQAEHPARVSPASLRAGLLDGNLYRTGESLEVLEIRPQPNLEDSSWCARKWHETQECTHHCYGQMRRWFCCK